MPPGSRSARGLHAAQWAGSKAPCASVGGMTELDPRLRAITDLNVADARESGGRHEYDGRIQDLSPEGVRAGLARLARAPRPPTRTTSAHLRVFEDGLRTQFGELELHRRNPLPHLSNLDLACYDRDYAPEAEREAAKAAHLARWPEAVDARDRRARPGQRAGREVAARRRARAWPPASTDAGRARRARAGWSRTSSGRPAIGDPDAVARRRRAGPADGRRRGPRRSTSAGWPSAPTPSATGCMALLTESCARLGRRTRPPLDVARELVRQHPDADGVIEAARLGTEQGHRVHPRARPGALPRRRVPGRPRARVAPLGDGDDVAGPRPASRTARPGTTSPRPTPPGPREDAEEWLEVFSDDHAARRSPCTRSRPGTSRTAGRCARRRLGRPAAAARRWRSSRAGRTTPRSSASRRGSRPTTRGSRSASGWRRWSGSPGWPARSACTPAR